MLPSSGRIFKIRIFKAGCRDPRATESAEFLKDNAGIRGLLNQSVILKEMKGSTNRRLNSVEYESYHVIY